MTTSRIRAILLALLVLAAAPRSLAAQAPLEGFIGSVARLWAAGDAGELAGLAPADGRILLDLGDGNAGAVEKRHVAAALRELFSGRENVGVRPAQVTISGGEPLRGFGELTWTSRVKGVSDAQTSTVYVGAVREGSAWKIRELRVLR
ncbi:MAG TPA: hypothetical protein VHG91_15655 [Longimicrobium sp.]|nr:hypothetical protein [Longimicrobium sp.]